jgi:hypothetical protein
VKVRRFDPDDDRIGIDGLLGLSFLKQFNYKIRSTEGRIVIERAAGRL